MHVGVAHGSVSFVYQNALSCDGALVRRTAALLAAQQAAAEQKQGEEEEERAVKRAACAALVALETMLGANQHRVVLVDGEADALQLVTPCLAADALLRPSTVVHVCDVDHVVRGTRGVLRPAVAAAVRGVCTSDACTDSSQFRVVALGGHVALHDVSIVRLFS